MVMFAIDSSGTFQRQNSYLFLKSHIQFVFIFNNVIPLMRATKIFNKIVCLEVN
jgi:hypothetical protein